MSKEDAIKVVQKLGADLGDNKGKLTVSSEEWAVLEGLLKRLQAQS